MKLSLKLQEHHHHHQSHKQNHHPPPPPPLLLRAKIPITIFNLPFLSHISTTTIHPSDLSLSLSTNFPSGPSLKFTYAAASAAAPPLTLSLKSGCGLFGSPNNSPLVISAHLSFNPSSNLYNPNPTFSLLFKPQLGSFSLLKSTSSHPTESSTSSEPTNGDAGFDSNSFGFVPLERPVGVKETPTPEIDKYSIFKGIQLAARTQMPMANRVALNFRWLVNFPKDDDMMPVLRINKIGIQRVDDVLKVKDDDDDDKRKKKKKGAENEVEMLKGMCYWMKKELDVLTKVNREMKYELEGLKLGPGGDYKEGVGKKTMTPAVERPSGGFEQWRSKRNGGGGDENGKGEEKKKGGLAVDVENELQRAISAAAAYP